MTEREQEILDKIINVLRKHLNPQTIYLFGSRSNGKHRKGSDFDFALTGLKPESSIQQKIKEDIEEFSGLYSFDIIYLGSVEKDFRDLVLRQGKVIYEK